MPTSSVSTEQILKDIEDTKAEIDCFETIVKAIRTLYEKVPATLLEQGLNMELWKNENKIDQRTKFIIKLQEILEERKQNERNQISSKVVQ